MAQPAGIVQLLESTADAAFAVDAGGIVRIWNTAASTLFGWRDADIVGMDWTKVLNGRGALGTSIGREVCDMALAGHTLPAFDAELRSRDGRRRWVSISTLVPAPARSHTRLVVFIAQDVHVRRTREHLVERMLAAADRLRSLGSDTGRPAPVSPLTAQEKRILRLFAQAWPIVDGAGSLVGIITRRDLIASVDREGAETLSVIGAGSSPAITTYADTLLEEAVSVMLARKVSRLPVVGREDPTRMIGLLEWRGLARAWQRATEDEHIRESTPRLGARLRLARRVRRRAAVRGALGGATEKDPA